MECPHCRSKILMIGQNTGLERIRSAFTGLREYRCRDCDTKFRAPDRRARPRDQKITAGRVAPKGLA